MVVGLPEVYVEYKTSLPRAGLHWVSFALRVKFFLVLFLSNKRRGASRGLKPRLDYAGSDSARQARPSGLWLTMLKQVAG